MPSYPKRRPVMGGTAINRRLPASAATTNATLARAGEGRVIKIRGYNAAASVKYLKLYNKATAPTVGTDVPIATFALKAADVFDIDFLPVGLPFSLGLGFAITGAPADADTTAVAANDIVGLNVWYE